jgi:hypothetical protein
VPEKGCLEWALEVRAPPLVRMSLALLVWEGMQKDDVRALCEASAFYARAI